jgi:hypothetical protein
LGKTVNELLGSVFSSEITEWMAFFQIQHEEMQPKEEQPDAKTKVRNIMTQFKGTVKKKNGTHSPDR